MKKIELLVEKQDLSLLTEDTELLKESEADIKVPGLIYKLGDPVFVGKIPLKQELTVIPGDTEAVKLGWLVKENIGMSVSNLRDPQLEYVTDVMEM